jgi:hypothetical protein
MFIATRTFPMHTKPLALLLLLSAAPSLHAGLLTFTGDLRNGTILDCGSGCTLTAADSDFDYAQWAAAEHTFSLSNLSTVQAVTFSYGGGTNGSGSPIADSGFEPYLSLFDAAGAFLGSTYFGVTCPTGANVNPNSGQCYDVLLDAGLLPAGNYSIVISAYANMSFAENFGSGVLADGFTGLGGLAIGEDLHYAFDVVIQDAAPTPEPANMGLIGAAALAAFRLIRIRAARRKRE